LDNEKSSRTAGCDAYASGATQSLGRSPSRGAATARRGVSELFPALSGAKHF